jgi:hypothetical protein
MVMADEEKNAKEDKARQEKSLPKTFMEPP